MGPVGSTMCDVGDATSCWTRIPGESERAAKRPGIAGAAATEIGRGLIANCEWVLFCSGSRDESLLARSLLQGTAVDDGTTTEADLGRLNVTSAFTRAVLTPPTRGDSIA